MTAEVRTQTRSNELTLLAFMATVVMLFAAFTSAYLIRRTGSDWQSVSLPGVVWANTALLLISSAMMELAKRKQSSRLLTGTIVLGIAFLGGQAFLWRALAAEGVTMSNPSYGSFVYLLSAVHGTHLIGGLLTLVFVTVKKRPFGLCALYWHFVVGLWCYLLLMLVLV